MTDDEEWNDPDPSESTTLPGMPTFTGWLLSGMTGWLAVHGEIWPAVATALGIVVLVVGLMLAYSIGSTVSGGEQA